MKTLTIYLSEKIKKQFNDNKSLGEHLLSELLTKEVGSLVVSVQTYHKRKQELRELVKEFFKEIDEQDIITWITTEDKYFSHVTNKVIFEEYKQELGSVSKYDRKFTSNFVAKVKEISHIYDLESRN